MIQWKQGLNGAGHWIGFDGAGEDVAGIFMHRATWRILRTGVNEWVLHQAYGSDWRFRWSDNTLRACKAAAEEIRNR
jgi:hypothetical protein